MKYTDKKNIIIGKKIKELRIKHELTQQELGEILKISGSHIGQVEKGNTGLSDENIKKLEQHFNILLTENAQNCIDLPFISASAGGGIQIIENQTYPVPINEIQGLGINFNNLVLVKVVGPSMTPIINNNDILVINRNYETVEDGEIYVVNYGDRILCKRVLTGAKYTILKSENPDYPPETIQGQEIEKLNIIGKVVYRMNRF